MNVPPCVSSTFSLLLRAALARPFTSLAMPNRFLVSAFLITGTIRLPLGNAVAIPMLISFLMMILSPSMLLLIIGNFLIQFTIASMKIGVKVIFSPYCFWNAFLFLSLHCTRLVTSHSVKLVTCGEVDLLRTI
ncbi:hypothetical protein D3C87_1819250 [compost metagenome]